MPFYVYAWVASFLFGSVAIIGKLTAKYTIPNAYLFNFLWMGFSLLLTIPIALVNRVGFPVYWPSLILVAIFNAAFGLLYIISLKYLDVSVLVPLLNFRTAFVAILGAVFLGEVLTFSQYLLVSLIFFCGLFVSMDEKLSLRSFFNWEIGMALLCTLSYTLMGLSINRAIAQNGYWTTTLWMAVLSQILLLVTFPFFKKDIGKLNHKQILSVFAMSLALALGILNENRAYQENVVITSIITALPISMIMVFILSIFSPKLLEKHTLKVYVIRFAAAALMILAAFRLST